MVKIPQFYKYKDYTLTDIEGNEHIIKVGEYKAVDMPYVLKLQQLQLELPSLALKAERFKEILKPILEDIEGKDDITEEEFQGKLAEEVSKLKEDDFSEEDIQEMQNATKDIQKLDAEFKECSAKLAQRGLKRFYYKEEAEYKEADRNNNLTEYIDSLPDIEMSVEDLNNIAVIMLQLGAPKKQFGRQKGNGKGKPKASKNK
jgi:hypothetical protein